MCDARRRPCVSHPRRRQVVQLVVIDDDRLSAQQCDEQPPGHRVGVVDEVGAQRLVGIEQLERVAKLGEHPAHDVHPFDVCEEGLAVGRFKLHQTPIVGEDIRTKALRL